MYVYTSIYVPMHLGAWDHLVALISSVASHLWYGVTDVV